MMTYNDTGIDCSNMKDTIVQCKNWNSTLGLKDLSTFTDVIVIFPADAEDPLCINLIGEIVSGKDEIAIINTLQSANCMHLSL
jgi:hypothetical protein